MYYKESSLLIDQSPLDKNAFRRLDREIAHAYAPSGQGYIDLPLLCSNTGLPASVVRTLLGRYESAGVVNSYIQVSCPCGVMYDPSDGFCMDCGQPVAVANPNGITCYRIFLKPTAPAYNPHIQSTEPNVFVSYRHSDCPNLAADIYYSLLAEEQSVFLDDGSIAVGADAEQSYLNAASNAKYFIALVSENYFQSDFCKSEIAHAARCWRRLIRVTVPPIPSAPSDMPWIDGPNWNKQQGSVFGLDSALEDSLLSAVQIQPSAATIADLRKEACQFLMEQLSAGEVERLWNRLPWMNDYSPENGKHQNIGRILRETTSQRLPRLCAALAPQI